MSYSDGAPEERNGSEPSVESSLMGAAWKLGGDTLICGACPSAIRFDSTGELVHADGSPVCVKLDVVVPGLSLDSGHRVEAQRGDMTLPDWAKLEAHHRMHVEADDGPRSAWRRGFQMALVTGIVLALAFGLLGYVWMALGAMGVELP